MTNQVDNQFVSNITPDHHLKLTENGADARITTGSALVNLFGVIGALRNRDESEIKDLFTQAYSEDSLLATKMSFYSRNIRGGLGERRVSKLIWKTLTELNPTTMKNNMAFIPLFGRWDDLFIFEGTPLEDHMWSLIRARWDCDALRFVRGNSISLMAKWLHSTDTSSSESRRLGRKTARRLGLSVKDYQKQLRVFRKHLDIVERKMSSNEWTEINYPAVPSRAMALYRKAFSRHDAEGFDSYINKVVSGEEKVNASTLYPYDIMEKLGLVDSRNYSTTNRFKFAKPDVLLEQQWKALPNYISGEHNVLVMADTSGSMEGRPMATSIGLAVYFAERNKGAFKDYFMTFSRRPSFVKLEGSTLEDKIKCIPAIVENTDLEAAFELVLQMGIQNNVPAEDMPKSIVVISDMEIDRGSNGIREDFYTTISRKFCDSGYDIPNIVFWNVDSRHNTFHAKSDVSGVQLASGQSPSVFKSILATIGKTAYEAMIETLSDPIYDCITL